MKGYRCTLPIDELNKLREEFWNSKGLQTGIWKYLKQACLMDDGICQIIIVRSANLLKQLQLTPLKGCINCTQDQDGKFYYVPNFCINDPFLEKQLKSTDKLKEIKNLKVRTLFSHFS